MIGDKLFVGEGANGLKIFVSDPGNERIQVYDRRQQFLASMSRYNVNGQLEILQPGVLSVNRLGEVFVVDESSGDLIKFNLNQRFEQRIQLDELSGGPESYSILAQGDRVYIGDFETGTVHVFSSSGNYITFVAPIAGIEALASGKAESVWAIGNGRLVHFSKRGRIERTIETGEPGGYLDLHVDEQANAVFLLTRSAVFRLSLPESGN